MSRKQTRRSISVNRVLYDQMKHLASVMQVPLAQLTEKALISYRESMRDPTSGILVPEAHRG
jgi:hypothetical protein